jgi:hypothetical protein
MMLRPDLSARVQNGPWTSQKAANISALLLYSHTITIRHNTLGYGENTSYSAPSTPVVPIKASVRHSSPSADATEFQSKPSDIEGNLCGGRGHKAPAASRSIHTMLYVLL